MAVCYVMTGDFLNLMLLDKKRLIFYHWGMSNQLSMRAVCVYGLAALFLCYEMALQVSPSVMTHLLMRDLHVNAAGLGLMAGFYFYSYTIMQIPAGLLYDRLSTRTIITLAVIVCFLGAFFFGATSTAVMAGLGRFMMGIGSAFAFIGVLVVASRWFPSRYFAFLVGIAQMLAAFGAMGGEVPLSAMVHDYGWRATIHWIAGIGLLLGIFIWLIMRDYPAGIKPRTMSSDNQLPIREALNSIFADRQTWWVALYAFCGWAPITAFAALWGVPYLMALYHINSTQAASLVAMIWLGLAITSPLLGWFSDKLGRRCILLSFCAFVGFVSSFCALYLPTVPEWLMTVLLFGFGIATAGQILSFAVVKDNNRQQVTATAIGFNNMAVVAGGALFQPLVGWLIHHHWSGQIAHGVPVYSVADYRFALMVVPLCFFIGFIVSRFMLIETYCRARYPLTDLVDKPAEVS